MRKSSDVQKEKEELTSKVNNLECEIKEHHDRIVVNGCGVNSKTEMSSTLQTTESNKSKLYMIIYLRNRQNGGDERIESDSCKEGRRDEGRSISLQRW